KRKSDNLSVKLALLGRSDRDRNSLRDALVRSGVIEIVDIFLHLAQEASFAQNEQAIQALPPQTAHKPLAYRVRARCLDRCVQHLNARPDGHSIKLCPVFAVVVADEKPGTLSEGRRLTQLLGYPGLTRMVRDADMHHPS